MRTYWTRLALAAAAAAGALWGGADVASAAYTADEEIQFASDLISFKPSFADYAQKVVDALVARDPSQQDRSKVIQAELFIQRREYDKAQAIVDGLGVANPKAQAIMLKLAAGYYNSGDQQKAVELFEGFFRQCGDNMPDDPDVARFYLTAAINFATIREGMNDWAGAAACYKRAAAAAAGNKALARDMLHNEAKAWIKAAQGLGGDERNKALDEAEKLCSDVIWGGLDVTFVKAIVTRAEAQLARGRPDEAQKTLKQYMRNIKQVDEMLQEEGRGIDESPMAGARSLLGRLMKEEAERLEQGGDTEGALAKYSEALGEYYNVFVKYGKGSYGPQAAMESKAIKDILETHFGKTVKIDLPSNMAARAAGTEFAMADDLFRRKDYGEAEKEYLRVLGQFPEAGELSVRAVANLLQCYVRQDDKLMAKATADYLAERLNRVSPLAAKGVLGAAEIYRKEKNDDEMRDWMFDTYLKRCPHDDQAGTILFFMASLAEKAGDAQRASQYLSKIITEHQDDKQYPLALSKQAWKAYASHEYADAVKGLAFYLKETQGQPSPLRAQALFALGDCLRRTKRGALAVKHFNALANALSTEPARWGSSAADLAKNKTLLEQTLFWRAFTLAQQEAEADRRAGVAQFDEFLKSYPQSAMAPKALKAMGSAQMALKDPAANETYARLAKEYPNTDEGKNAQYTRISGALELGQLDQAREAARAMVASANSFKPEEFLRVGNELLDNGIHAEAESAFKQVTDRAQDRALLERAWFGLGKARHGTGDDKGAVDAMNELMNRWPKSQLFYEAKFTLAEANLKLGDTAAAKDALNSILRFADQAGVSVDNQASLLMAQVQKSEGDKTGAAQTYQRMEYLNLLNMPTEKERAQMKRALLESMALEEELQDYARLQETAEAFLENFSTSAEVPDVRAKKNAASLKLSMAAASDAAGAAGADGGEGEAGAAE